MTTEPDFTNEITISNDLSDLVQTAKTDKHALNILIRDYMPFIKKCLASVFFKTQSKADNLTDAMLAFTHSVKTYKPEQGAFIQYAATVIRNRLIDSVRKELSTQKHFWFFSPKKNETDIEWENHISLQAYNQAEEEQNLRIEIEEVNNEFTQWGFSWETLEKKCPKQERSRHIATQIAETILNNAILLSDIHKTHQLPISQLEKIYPKKALERYRQYIIALIIILQGDYPYIYSFLPHYFTRRDKT